jgi:hypothetical protein
MNTVISCCNGISSNDVSIPSSLTDCRSCHDSHYLAQYVKVTTQGCLQKLTADCLVGNRAACRHGPIPNGTLFPIWCTTFDQGPSRWMHYIGNRVPFETPCPLLHPFLKIQLNNWFGAGLLEINILLKDKCRVKMHCLPRGEIRPTL